MFPGVLVSGFAFSFEFCLGGWILVEGAAVKPDAYLTFSSHFLAILTEQGKSAYPVLYSFLRELGHDHSE